MKSRQSTLPTTISPREIQQEIRLGATVAELVASSGADEELIAKFAAPIISELNHVVLLARNVRLSLAGDRFTDPTQVEFGSVMDERLFSNGATQTTWRSRKSLEGEWLVSVSFKLAGDEGIATWSFDPKQLFLVPENETALQLSNGLPVTTSGTSKVRNLETETTTNFVAPVIEEIVEEQTQTSGLSIVPEIAEVEEEEITFTEEVETSTRAQFHVVEDEPVDEYLDETFEEEIVIEEVVEEAEDVVVTEQIAIAQPEEDSSPKPQSTSRWAEVLFGSKDDEEEN
jgi:hypothetical protein